MYLSSEGDALNDVEKILNKVGIALRDTQGNFRDMGEVLSEVAGRWKTMNSLEQSATANAIAGVRQRENFLTLMVNWNKVLELQTAQTESAGLATQRYGIYLEGIEASANKAKAAWQGVWQATINSDAIKFFYD